MLSSYANYGYEILEHSNHYEYWGIIRSLPEHPLISNPYRGRELCFAFSSSQTPNQLYLDISISYPWNQPYILNSRGRGFV